MPDPVYLPRAFDHDPATCPTCQQELRRLVERNRARGVNPAETLYSLMQDVNGPVSTSVEAPELDPLDRPNIDQELVRNEVSTAVATGENWPGIARLLTTVGEITVTQPSYAYEYLGINGRDNNQLRVDVRCGMMHAGLVVRMDFTSRQFLLTLERACVDLLRAWEANGRPVAQEANGRMVTTVIGAPTPETQDEWDREMAARRRQAAERASQEELAERVAIGWLREHLTDQQLLDFDAHRWIAQETRIGVFVLTWERSGGVIFVPYEKGKIVQRLCAVVFSDLPTGDQVLAQLLMVRTNPHKLISVAYGSADHVSDAVWRPLMAERYPKVPPSPITDEMDRIAAEAAAGRERRRLRETEEQYRQQMVELKSEWDRAARNEAEIAAINASRQYPGS